VSEFYRRKDKWQAICKTCFTQKYCDKVRVKRKIKLSKELADKNRSRINEIKQKFGCWFCNESEAACMDFHHVDPRNKEKEIARMITYRWESIVSELSKCIVVCANCHRKIHAGILDAPQSSPLENLIS
jgi:hypothetical protein